MTGLVWPLEGHCWGLGLVCLALASGYNCNSWHDLSLFPPRVSQILLILSAFLSPCCDTPQPLALLLSSTDETTPSTTAFLLLLCQSAGLFCTWDTNLGASGSLSNYPELAFKLRMVRVAFLLFGDQDLRLVLIISCLLLTPLGFLHTHKKLYPDIRSYILFIHGL